MSVAAAFIARPSFPASDAAQREVACRLLRRGLARFGVGASARVERNSFGRPSVVGRPDVHFSVAHCPRAAVVVVASDRVGIDVEALRPHDRFAATRALDEVERARVDNAADSDREFFRLWTLKESYVKALGVGLSYPLRTLRLTIGVDGTASCGYPRTSLRVEESFPGLVIGLCRLGEPVGIEIDIESHEW